MMSIALGRLFGYPAQPETDRREEVTFESADF